jgi:hypothetical protein
MPVLNDVELKQFEAVSQIFADTFDPTQYKALKVDYYVAIKALRDITPQNLQQHLFRHVHGFDGAYLIDSVDGWPLETIVTQQGELIKLNVGDE